MLKPNQTVVAKWGTKNKKRLVSLGYEFTHMGDAVLIKVEHLAYCSRVEVSYICDYCGEEVTTRYQTYNEGHKYCEKDACKKCAPLKSRDAFYEKYGVTNPLQVKEINEKQRKTCVKRYGAEYALQNKEFLEKKDNTCIQKYGTSSVLLNQDIAQKKKNTCLKRFGCENPMQNKDIWDRRIATCFERYGVGYAIQLPEYKEKMKQTFIQRYGVEYPLQYPEFAEKAQINIKKTMFAHGTTLTSKAQYSIYEMCQEEYGKDATILNKPLYIYSLDVALEYRNTLIDIEYDGIFWHTDPEKDKKRDEVVKSYGYKVLRILGKSLPPEKQKLTNAIETLVNSNDDFMSINADL